jgi:hypothetical protein
MNPFDQLLTRYERSEISRRDLLAALALTAVGGIPGAGQVAAAQGRTLNHVSLGVTDLRRSTEFYDRLLHLSRAERHAAEIRLVRLERATRLGPHRDAE